MSWTSCNLLVRNKLWHLYVAISMCVNWNEKKKQVFAQFLCECWLKSELHLCKLSEIVTSSPCLKQALEANRREVTIHVSDGRRPEITSLRSIRSLWMLLEYFQCKECILHISHFEIWGFMISRLCLKVDQNSFKSAVVIGHSGHFLFSLKLSLHTIMCGSGGTTFSECAEWD